MYLHSPYMYTWDTSYQILISVSFLSTVLIRTHMYYSIIIPCILCVGHFTVSKIKVDTMVETSIHPTMDIVNFTHVIKDTGHQLCYVLS